MVGGRVAEIIPLAGKIWVNVQDTVYNPVTGSYDRLGNDFCAVYVERNETSERIKKGDSLWWQGRSVMWTPPENRVKEPNTLKCGVDYDIEIPRIGYSGVSRPALRESLK